MIAVWFIAMSLGFVACGSEDPIVQIPDGKLRGKVLLDIDGNPFYSFQSIPYAKPPVEKLRFKDPVPAEPWDGIRDATQDMPECFQKMWSGAFIGEEDCLYVDVYTPEISTDDLKPVMVFIHGGGFTEGTGRKDLYGPEFLITEDVLVVTLNYRLGVLGFLNIDNPKLGVPGNAALKDQSLALRWVQKNIKYFGGDPNLVTIFGESAGGASVHFQMISPMSQGLFQRVIAMSGTALNVWDNGIQNIGSILARNMGYSGDDDDNLLDFWQNVRLEELKKVLENATILIPLHVQNTYGPVKEQSTENAFLPDTAKNLVKAGNFQKVPFMIGVTDQDGMLVDVLYWLKTNEYKGLPVEKFIPYFFNQHEKDKIVKELETFYFKDPKAPQVQELIDLATDGYFTNGLYETLFGHSKQQQDIYLYLFSSDTKLNFFKRSHPVTSEYKGACHIDDIGHLFTSKTTPEITKGSIEDKARRLAVKVFTNFAKYGNPAPTDELGVKWPKLVGNSFDYVNIYNDKLSVKSGLFKERAVFWCDAYNKFAPGVEHLCDWNEKKKEL